MSLWLNWSRGPVSLVQLGGPLTRIQVQTGSGQQFLGLPIIAVCPGSWATKSALECDIIHHSSWYIVWPDRSEHDCLLNIQPI